MTGRGRQYRQIEAANQMLSQEALSDALTNLGNRNRFEKTIQAFEFDKHGCGTLGCIYININTAKSPASRLLSLISMDAGLLAVFILM